ncbi:MAG: PAS-domain containing protein, partial [Alphaproteobacteria bacterium]|nr:PAS-domain containing protein [Alphaproteobacteria bacterium]
IDSMADGVIIFDAEERLVALNRRYSETYSSISDLLEPGALFEDLIRVTAEKGLIANIIGHEAAWIEQRLAVFRQGQSAIEQQMADGRWLHITERKTPNGYTVGIRTDITKLKQSEILLYDAVQAMSEGFALYDADERLVICNQPYRETLPRIAALGLLTPGTTLEEIVRAGIKHGFTPTAYDNAEDYIATRMERFRNPAGPYEYVTTNGQWIRFEEKKTTNGATVAIRTDITKHRQLEQQVRQSQKMEAIGQLTGGVAHDFNNMLAAIIGNLELIQDGGMAEESEKESIAIALKAAFRGAELTQRLLAFSRQQELDAKVIDINQLLPQFSKLAQRTIGADIAIEMKLAANLWPAMVDAGQLENALLNLAINARDAMPSGGPLIIETSNQGLEEGDAAASRDLPPGDYVMIAVSDGGIGMSPEVRERVFEPFFTTKDVGQGTGLGLSMVFGFAKQSGGQVSIYSEVGEGTTVRIYLPRAEKAANAENATALIEKGRPKGDERILVVEDDESVRDYLVTVLRQLGYGVQGAEDGPAALAVMAASGPFDLLLTDVVLPRGMSGRDVAIAFSERYPAAGVIYSSGYTREILNRRGQLEAGVVLMNKPYQTPALAQRVREVLDRGT